MLISDNMTVTRRVKQIIDGDTFFITQEIQDTNKIRLANVDTPEKYTSAGRIATNVLRGLIGGKIVSILPVGRSYDRIVATVICEGRNINKIMKEKGY